MEVDHIIVGAGIAGISLALELHREGEKLAIWDSGDPHASSRIAAGIMNPIVPKRITKTWMADEIFPKIEAWYRHWENMTGVEFYQTYPLYQIHANARDSNEWQAKTETLYPFLSEANDKLPDAISAPFGHTMIHFAGRLDVPLFCATALNYLAIFHKVFQESFHYSGLTKTENSRWNYQTVQATNIIFCEGAKAMENPWFNYLPFIPSGGDILELAIPGMEHRNRMFKQKSWLVPVDGAKFLAGSTFHPNNLDTVPMESDREELITGLKKWIKTDIEVLSHKRAVRPTVKDRRPFLGEHKSEKGLYIFNGLGTKGSSLCTWLAPVLTDHILHGSPIPKEVDIQLL